MENSEAEKKYEKYKSLDPYPDIQPALLNSADIEDYVNTTGMIDPYYPDKLKSASYEAKIKGKCIYWDENGNKQEIDIDQPYTSFILRPNSIAFVEVEPTFRLPDYIALRFNLKITHVYRGLLLGTGPLIDPGYVGKIYIPLHNLTSNPYTFEYEEGLIWVEFTKISNSERWKYKEELNKAINRKAEYKPFPPNKMNKKLGYFLHKAAKGKPIKSSIPSAVEDAKKMAKNAENSAKWIRNISIATALALVLSIVTLIYNSWLLQRNYVKETSGLTSDLKIQINNQTGLYQKIKKDLASANIQIKMMKEKIDSLEQTKK